MVIVDSLPPGNYRLTKLLTIPLSVGDKAYNTQGRPADIRFRLAAGNITIASKSLYVRTFNAIPGRGLSTTYESHIKPTTGQQRSDLLIRLEALPSFSAWEVLSREQSLPGPVQTVKKRKKQVAADDFKFEWSGFWRPVSEAVTGSCVEGSLSLGLVGSRLEGEGVDSEGSQYRITASLLDDGIIRGKLSLDRKRVARITGKLYDDGSILGSFDYGDDCRAEWKARIN